MQGVKPYRVAELIDRSLWVTLLQLQSLFLPPPDDLSTENIELESSRRGKTADKRREIHHTYRSFHTDRLSYLWQTGSSGQSPARVRARAPPGLRVRGVYRRTPTRRDRRSG